ncbi:MAG: hypothetical protein NZ898_02850 [Myxococcota bacterium]|nr:hypothetical protein [Myxococcota bacterium]MDW8361312.1 hypothetical protein [Myxococcales bacterium]
MPGLAQGSNRFEHFLDEALESVAVAPVRDRIVRDALRRARLGAIPDAGPSLRRFVDGALHDAVNAALGPLVAAEVVAALAPVVDMLADDEEPSRIRRSSSPGHVPDASARRAPRGRSDPSVSVRPSLDAAPRPPSSPAWSSETAPTRGHDIVVAVVSARDDVAPSLESLLGPRATIVSVADGLALLDAVEAADRDATCWVLVDCACPSVHPLTVAALALDMHGRTRLLLWGPSLTTRAEVEALCEARPVVTLLPGSPVAAVAARIVAEP